jgi:hypothetical protein
MTRRYTIGDAESAQYTQFAAAAAGTAISGAAAAGFLAASTAGPIGAGIALAAMVISSLIANSGCGPTCVIATHIVDDLEPQLRANKDSYLAGRRTAADQAAALSVFDITFAWLRSAQACGAPELHDAGARCISDRAPGGKLDWYKLYRDPIAADQPAAGGDVLDFGAKGNGIPVPLMIAAAAILLGVIL